MSVKKKRTIGPCRGVTWLYYVVFLWSRDFFPPLYLDPRFRPLLLKFSTHTIYIYIYVVDFGKHPFLLNHIILWGVFFFFWGGFAT